MLKYIISNEPEEKDHHQLFRSSCDLYIVRKRQFCSRKLSQILQNERARTKLFDISLFLERKIIMQESKAHQIVNSQIKKKNEFNGTILKKQSSIPEDQFAKKKNLNLLLYIIWMEKYFPFHFIALKQYEQIKMSTEDQNYQQVVQIFRRRGFSHRENVHEETVLKIFNELALQNIKREFDDKLFDELISECRNRHFGELSPHNLGTLISEAKTILEERLERLHSQVGFIKDRETLIQEKRAQLETKQNSEDIIPDQEKIEHDLMELQKELTEFQRDSNVFGLQLQMIDSLLQPILNTEQKTQIQTTQSKHAEYTNKLPTAFYCTMGCLAMEPILCLIRPSFITILIILHVCYIIFLGYNSRKSVMYLLCELIVNFLLDLLYLIGCFYFNFQFPSSRYGQHSILYTICLSTLIVSSVLRIAVFINFYPFREPKNHSVLFKILKQEFELHRKSHQAFGNPLNSL